MSVLIKGMERPTSCGQCRFFAWSRGVGQHCAVNSDITFHATINGMDVAYERNGNCPLVPVPTHGRLIDAEALLELYEDPDDMRLRDMKVPIAVIRQNIMDMPTIIPASEEGEA